MGVLEAGLSDGGDDSSTSRSSADEGEELEGDARGTLESGPAAKRPKKVLTMEDLERAGYQSGPSVLFMKPQQAEGQTDWNWSNGREKKQDEDEEGDREATRTAVTTGVEESAEYAMKAMAHAAKLREDARAEKERLAQEKRLSFNQKEKRKRDEGKQARDKSTVEESKRQAREFGIYSGFD